MRRRAFLATAAAASLVPASLAGCSGTGALSPLSGHNAAARAPTARFEMESIDDAALPSKVLHAVGTTEGSDPDPDPGPDSRLFERIRDGGATTRATRPPLPAEEHVAFDDGVYELSREIVEETPATRYSVTVDIAEGTPTESETILYADLPEVDKREFEDRGLEDGEPIGVGTGFLYTDAERERSVLVPDSAYSYVRWADGAVAEWVVDDSRDVTLYTYRYSATQVDSAADYGRRMRGQYAFELSGLPEGEREIVESAISDGPYLVGPDESPSSAMVSLADRFRGREQARGLAEDGEGDLSGSYLVQRDGETYWTTLVVRSEAFTSTRGEE